MEVAEIQGVYYIHSRESRRDGSGSGSCLTWNAMLAFSCRPKISGSSIIGSPSMYCLYSCMLFMLGA